MWKNMTFEFESMEQFQPKRQGKIPVAERAESSFRAQASDLEDETTFLFL